MFKMWLRYTNRYKEYYGAEKVGLLHGKLTSDEKDEVMQRFSDKDIDILVSTTVVEVGVNVPNATFMMIYDADRFGLSTLHQCVDVWEEVNIKVVVLYCLL